jgi:hypothetical protein
VPGQLGDRRAEREPVEVPADRLRQREQAQRLRGRPAVDDHDLERALVREPGHLGEREQLVDPRQDGQLGGVQVGHAGEHPAQAAPDRLPRPVGETARGDVGRVQAGVHFGRFGAHPRTEDVTERVGGVGRRDEHLAPADRQPGSRRRGEGGLADASLAGEQQRAR